MKKLLKYLMILIVAATITLGAVAAADIVSHDFDGKFTADVPSNADFKKMADNESAVVYVDTENSLYIVYTENENINDDTIGAFYKGFTDNDSFEKLSTEGNLTIFKVNDDNIGAYGAGVNTDGAVVIICGENADQVKEIANSVTFKI